MDILYGLKWKEILEMEMDMNWSKPKVLLSLRDTQGSPDVFSQIAQSQNVVLHFTLIALYMQSAYSLLN